MDLRSLVDDAGSALLTGLAYPVNLFGINSAVDYEDAPPSLVGKEAPMRNVLIGNHHQQLGSASPINPGNGRSIGKGSPFSAMTSGTRIPLIEATGKNTDMNGILVHISANPEEEPMSYAQINQEMGRGANPSPGGTISSAGKSRLSGLQSVVRSAFRTMRLRRKSSSETDPLASSTPNNRGGSRLKNKALSAQPLSSMEGLSPKMTSQPLEPGNDRGSRSPAAVGYYSRSVPRNEPTAERSMEACAEGGEIVGVHCSMAPPEAKDDECSSFMTVTLNSVAPTPAHDSLVLGLGRSPSPVLPNQADNPDVLDTGGGANRRSRQAYYEVEFSLAENSNKCDEVDGDPASRQTPVDSHGDGDDGMLVTNSVQPRKETELKEDCGDQCPPKNKEPGSISPGDFDNAATVSAPEAGGRLCYALGVWKPFPLGKRGDRHSDWPSVTVHLYYLTREGAVVAGGGRDVQYVCRIHPTAPFSVLLDEIRARETGGGSDDWTSVDIYGKLDYGIIRISSDWTFSRFTCGKDQLQLLFNIF